MGIKRTWCLGEGKIFGVGWGGGGGWVRGRRWVVEILVYDREGGFEGNFFSVFNSVEEKNRAIGKARCEL